MKKRQEKLLREIILLAVPSSKFLFLKLHLEFNAKIGYLREIKKLQSSFGSVASFPISPLGRPLSVHIGTILTCR